MIIKILDLNLWQGGLLFPQVLKFLKAEKPDIICLQEVFNGQDDDLPENYRSVEVLTKNFPDFYYYFSPEFKCITDQGKIDQGNLILSRFPLYNQQTIFLRQQYGEYPQNPKDGDYSQDPKNMQQVEVEINEQMFNVCNLHGIWGLDGGDNQARLTMSKIIVQQIEHLPRVLLMGDFNLKPNTQTINNIEQHLTNLFADELFTSFNTSRKDLVKYPGYASAVVDMFFASPDLNIVSKRCPDVDVSDHLPLMVEIAI